jgi:hypothetical protein
MSVHHSIYWHTSTVASYTNVRVAFAVTTYLIEKLNCPRVTTPTGTMSRLKENTTKLSKFIIKLELSAMTLGIFTSYVYSNSRAVRFYFFG